MGLPIISRNCGKVRLWLELVALFFVIPPLFLFVEQYVMKGAAVGAVLLGALAATFILVYSFRVKGRQIWRGGALRAERPWIVLRALIGITGMLAIISVFIPSQLFQLPPNGVPMLLVASLCYVGLSVAPQELIYREYFFRRYSRLFSGQTQLIFFNAFCFGAAHIVFGNWQAVALSFLAGLVFAYTYSKTRSLLCVCIEHAVWGLAAFWIGLGTYFHLGALAEPLMKFLGK